MPIENVIILGAGASASEGEPLQKDLFREYYTARREGTLETPDYRGEGIGWGVGQLYARQSDGRLADGGGLEIG
jgi:hypothetical protein